MSNQSTYEVPPNWVETRAMQSVAMFLGFMFFACMDVFTSEIPQLLQNKPFERGLLGALIGFFLATFLAKIVFKKKRN